MRVFLGTAPKCILVAEHEQADLGAGNCYVDAVLDAQETDVIAGVAAHERYEHNVVLLALIIVHRDRPQLAQGMFFVTPRPLIYFVANEQCLGSVQRQNGYLLRIIALLD